MEGVALRVMGVASVPGWVAVAAEVPTTAVGAVASGVSALVAHPKQHSPQAVLHTGISCCGWIQAAVVVVAAVCPVVPVLAVPALEEERSSWARCLP